jgi:hypothetical protein
MKYLALVCCLGLSTAACDGGPERRSPLPQPSPVVPTPEPPPPPSPPPPPAIPAGARVIAVGEEVKDTYLQNDRYYVLTAPTNGWLAVRLNVPGELSGATMLRLQLNGANVPSHCCAWEYPIGARMAVVSGQQVLVAVSNAGGAWDYLQVGPLAEEGLPFVLSTAIE